jgi:hypothetical protein
MKNKLLIGGIIALSVGVFIAVNQPDPLGDSSYPTLKDGVQYFKSTFTPGLRYSEGWYGTFGYAPDAEVLLFDDDLGICIFSMPIGKKPLEGQDGTKLTTLSKAKADAEIKKYSIDNFKPLDIQVKETLNSDDYFTGVWAGEKLKEKFSYEKSITDLTADEIKQ